MVRQGQGEPATSRRVPPKRQRYSEPLRSPTPETSTVVPPSLGPPDGSSVWAGGVGYCTKRVSSVEYCWPLALTSSE